MKRLLFGLFCLFLLGALAMFYAPPNPKKLTESKPATAGNELPKLDKFEPSWVDQTKDPCTDFYQYSCSKWIAANPIPSDMASSSTALPLYLYNQTILRQALESAAADKNAKGSERQIGVYWRSCMDTAGRNANGKAWLQPSMKVIDSLQSSKDLPRVLAYLHTNFPAPWAGDDNSTKAPIFGLGPIQDHDDATQMDAAIDQGGMALPSRQYYLENDAHFKGLRDKYVQHVQKMFELAGDSPAVAAAQAKVVLDMETAFARASMDNVTRRDPVKTFNKRSLQQLKAAVPDFGWEEYFSAMQAPGVPFYVVTAPPFLEEFERQLKTRSPQDWCAYLRWWVIHRAAPYLGSDFEQANFDYFGTALSGVPQMLPPWRRCVASVDHALGEALGQAYVNVAFPPEAKNRANELVHDVRDALDNEFQQLDWMADATKKQALEKEHATLQKIGYPDQWRDYSSVKIVPDHYLANLNAATEFEMHRQLKKVGKPVDRNEWDMTPPTINAYEDAQMNTINFPAGILQLPFFSLQQMDAMNYGAIGMVIGHEMTHGFDDQGRKFDTKGNLRDWWTPEDAKRYEEKDKCIVDQYTQPIPDLGVKQDGHLTAGEDTADNGGIHLAMLALEARYKKEGNSLDKPEADGLTARQRFFLAYAFSWCHDTRPEAARAQVVSNPHSLPQFRVNYPLSNSPEFRQAFGCKPGQKMVHEPACRVW